MNPEAKPEARSSIDTLLSTLKERLAQPGTSLLPLLNTMSRFSRYSLANQFLVFAQRPDATRVQGYRAWHKAGYQVRKGEHGIVICAPMRFTPRDSDTLAHETTHVLLHFPTDGSSRPDLVTRETEAGAVTYLLCTQLGIAGTDASVEYIQFYRGTPDTLDASLERIRATAQRLSSELDAIRFDAKHDPGPA